MNRWLVAAVGLGLVAAGVSFSSTTRDVLLAARGEDAVILDTDYDVIVAVVESNETPDGRNGNPPQLVLDVIEVLRGDEALNRSHAVWVPFHIGRPRPKGWKEKPLRGPSPGQKFVLVGVTVDHSGQQVFNISALGRFKFDADRYDRTVTAIQSVPVLRTEREEYRDAWPRWFTTEELRDGARPVTNETVLKLEQPILMKWATLGRGRVVGLLPDGRVKVRSEGRDSRWDHIENRENLLLYPERLLTTQELGGDRPHK